MDRGRHDNTETRAKKLSFSVYVFVDLGTIMGFLSKPNRTSMSRSLTVDFILFFLFIFNFLFLEQLGLGFISHAVTSVKKLMA